MQVHVLVGSLRSGSFGRKIARAAEDVSPDEMNFEVIDGRELPLFDQDLDGDEKPTAVQRLIDQVTSADALLFITPEFNYGIPGTLKNAIDWASRPPYHSPLKNKPAVIISYSVAPTGGSRAHLQLSSVLSGTLTPVMVAPGFSIPAIHEKFDEAGVLTDEMTRKRLIRTLEDFAEWAKSLED